MPTLRRIYTNNAASTLYSNIGTGALSMTVQTGDGALFPAPTGQQYFYVTLFKVVGSVESSHEVVKVTARTGDTFTIVRAQEGTSAKAFVSGDRVELRVTAENMNSAGMLIANGNYLGIGTASATCDLDISGSLRVLSTGTNIMSGDTPDSTLELSNSGGGSALELTANMILDTNYLKIKGRFAQSNEGERTMFQTVDANASTNVGAVPAGASQTASFQVYNDASPLNTSRGVFGITAGSVQLSADRIGSGSYLPIEIVAGGTTKLTVATNGYFTFGAGARIMGDTSNATLTSRLIFQDSGTNSVTNINVIPNGTGVTTRINLHNNSDPTNSARALLACDNAFVTLSSAISGSGTYLPMKFSVNNATCLTFPTTGNAVFGSFGNDPGFGGSWRVVSVVGGSTTDGGVLHLENSDASVKADFLVGSAFNATLRTTTNHPLSLAVNSTERLAIGAANAKFTYADATVQFLLAGTTKGIRMFTNSNGGGVEGVDYTGVTTYQPLYVGGSTLTFSISGVAAVAIDASKNVILSNNAFLQGTFDGAAASRTGIRTNTTNANTTVDFVPNGTGTAAYVAVYGGSDRDNTHYGYLGITGTELLVASNKTGTGTTKGIGFFVGGVRALAVGSDLSWTFGNTTNSGVNFEVVIPSASNTYIRARNTAASMDFVVGSAGNGVIRLNAAYDLALGTNSATAMTFVGTDNSIRIAKAVTFDQYTITTTTGAATVAFATNGQRQKVTLTGNWTPTFTYPSGTGTYYVMIISGAYGITWPSIGANWQWANSTAAPTLNTGTYGGLLTIVYDGTLAVASYNKIGAI